ncbi:uncharacterized protein LOC133531154 [Cydia pomonella]|uniref:uncharacterized protein LOC133531154 n=1 Tax=Cydia pomonella TaxID=82600 RepID=UPI002ADD362A|nr:uncharacterized protein LOC133531154 [Cydia pomonella]
MKIVFVCLVFVGLALAKPAGDEDNSRGCIMGSCPLKCPPGTYRYAVGCDYLLPEPTCKNPRPVKETKFQICDFQACYCSPPTVRNEETNQCVRLCD